MPITLLVSPTTGLHHETRIARNGLLAAGDCAAALAGRTNSALGRRQRTLAGAAAPYTALTGAAQAVYRFAGHTTPTCTRVIARWTIGPRYAAAASDPMGTIQLHTRKTGDGAYKAHPLIYVGTSNTTASTWLFNPDQVTVLEQPIEELTTTSADGTADLEIDGYVEVSYGARVMEFELVEETRTTLATSEGAPIQYSLPGMPIKADPASTVWTKIGSLWGSHGPVLAWQLYPFGRAMNTTTAINLIDGATGSAWNRAAVRTTFASLPRLGQTTVPTTVWVIGSKTISAVALTWRLIKVASDGTETELATDTITDATATVHRKSLAWTPDTDPMSYQMQFKSGAAGNNVTCWSWGWYLEGS